MFQSSWVRGVSRGGGAQCARGQCSPLNVTRLNCSPLPLAKFHYRYMRSSVRSLSRRNQCSHKEGKRQQQVLSKRGHRGKVMWQAGWLQAETSTHLISWAWGSSLLASRTDWQKIRFYCLSHPASAELRQRELKKQAERRQSGPSSWESEDAGCSLMLSTGQLTCLPGRKVYDQSPRNKH